MTTIAYRDGVMAADSQVNYGDVAWANARKILKLPNGALVGACGNAYACTRLMRLLEVNGGEITDQILQQCKDAWAIYVEPDGSLLHLGGGKNGGVDELVNTPFLADGSGYVAAMAAMHQGASAVRAVEVAALLDNNTSLPVVFERLTKKRAPATRRKKK